ncbi:MAG: hypothetical protein ACJAYU_001794 [Bradymonadia bacterium]|jgi:hypothetical protein
MWAFTQSKASNLMSRNIPNKNSTHGDSASTLIHLKETSQVRRLEANHRAIRDGVIALIGLGLLVTICAVI